MVSHMAKAGGGGDPIIGGRTNSSINGASDNITSPYIMNEDNLSMIPDLRGGSFKRIREPIDFSNKRK